MAGIAAAEAASLRRRGLRHLGRELVLERALKNGGMTPKTFDAAEPALDALRSDVPDVLVTDIRMPGQSGLEMLRRIHVSRPQLPVIVMTAHAEADAE